VPSSAARKAPAGWGPRDIEHAYKLPVGRDSHALVAVVEAFDTPKLETYLNVYRKQYGLGPCTVGNGCFRKVGQNGSARHLPPSGVLTGWDLEATLDVDMVSAACPTCRILVVEANGQAFNQLAAAEDTAARLGAVAISNSYGARETGFLQSFAQAYRHRGATIVVSSGDFGFTAASFPANLATVTAAGGTQLSRAHNKRGWSEAVWNSEDGAGASGCSAYVAKPSWQHDKDCPGRTVADVSAVAYNLAIYNKDWGGWGLVGGTSASSPIIAGIYGLAGNAAGVRPGYEYAHANALFDVTRGNNDWFYGENGAACGYDYLCMAQKGYDAPTGLGSPDGIGAF
jgi:subtilase family serine protease